MLPRSLRAEHAGSIPDGGRNDPSAYARAAATHTEVPASSASTVAETTVKPWLARVLDSAAAVASAVPAAGGW